jgi:hypothetical protein
MSEDDLVQTVSDAVTRLGERDDITAAGRFFPRGHFGGAFTGGMLGGQAGDLIGGLAGGVGVAGGAIAGQHAADAASGLPERMLVGVSPTTVYGFDAHKAQHGDADALLFRIPREHLDVKVHQRVNVRVLELIHEATGSKVELEGARLPGQHAGAVIDALRH